MPKMLPLCMPLHSNVVIYLLHSWCNGFWAFNHIHFIHACCFLVMYRNTSQVQMSTIGSSKIAHSLSTPTLGPRINHTLFLTSMGFFATPDKSKMFHMFVFVAPKIWTTTGKLSLTIRLFEYVLACNASYGRSNIWFAWYCGASWCRRTLSPSLPSCSHPPPSLA